MEIRQKDFGQIRIISVSSIQYNIVNELMRYKCMETWESSITLGATNVVWYEVEITRLLMVMNLWLILSHMDQLAVLHHEEPSQIQLIFFFSDT